MYYKVFIKYVYVYRNKYKTVLTYIVWFHAEGNYYFKFLMKICSTLIKSDLSPHIRTPAAQFWPAVTGSARRMMRCTSVPRWQWCRRSQVAVLSSTATAHEASTSMGIKWLDRAPWFLRRFYSGTWAEAVQWSVFYRKCRTCPDVSVFFWQVGSHEDITVESLALFYLLEPRIGTRTISKWTQSFSACSSPKLCVFVCRGVGSGYRSPYRAFGPQRSLFHQEERHRSGGAGHGEDTFSHC